MAKPDRAWVESHLSILCSLIHADGYRPYVHRHLSAWNSIYIEIARPCRTRGTYGRTAVWLRVSDHKHRPGARAARFSIYPGGQHVRTAWDRAKALVESQHEKKTRVRRQLRQAKRAMLEDQRP